MSSGTFSPDAVAFPNVSIPNGGIIVQAASSLHHYFGPAWANILSRTLRLMLEQYDHFRQRIEECLRHKKFPL